MAKINLIIPAAGTGQRMQSEQPKQYLQLNGLSLLGHSVSRFQEWASQYQHTLNTVVVLPKGDTLPSEVVGVVTCTGGASRADSVFAGLKALASLDALSEDWVMVHDAARPLVLATDIERLYQTLVADEVGGILAEPITATVKQAKANVIEKTLNRESLFLAQTPQMFRFGLLMQALIDCDRSQITDEAAAVEGLGLCPKVVLGSRQNIKITVPEDLVFAQSWLKHPSED
ncbi:2-C-methyl-D-erythritol 4-phosphate cytidylyltransferase [Ostreibacterium oceani]|uniref:2-C-methyl-D-erythritol 4-phosphate cytidylyltransferase n=1 Tax=Ostreibacterium oceani TaxID=2654998 RepID=A0A6N7EVP6_9GAMM|nr:2-C-methyl-D-erythritol 4-phosphate cytidylyltransferase [Ostreibacterium oceani]MPV85620.1 2-C-methyl-D-erythritol 4-phosphate cytidylyltransferase [Ostreibacterium oceani]